MSRFYDNTKDREEARARAERRREKLAAYLSKLSFGGIAVGAGVMFVKDPMNLWCVEAVILGVYLTVIFAYIACEILKYNNKKLMSCI